MKHLKESGEPYFVHMIEAWIIVISLVYAAVVCLIHSFLPFLFKKTASNTIRLILNRTDKRYAK